MISIQCFLLIACAKKGFPPGGPPDTAAPEIISTYPETNSIKINLTSEISISFSEKMNKLVTESSIFISPAFKADLDFDWQKNKLIIKPPHLLTENKTYVVTVSTTARDIHNNALKNSFAFAFSTGETLDSGQIDGKVFYQNKAAPSIFILTYLLKENFNPDPSTDKPDYIGVTGPNGEFKISFLSAGNYRLFALKDSNKDLLWDIQNELIGIGSRDLTLESNSAKAEMDFILSQKDTASFGILNCQCLDRQTVMIEFNKAVDKKSATSSSNYLLRQGNTSLEIEDIYFKEENPKKIYLVVNPETSSGLSPKTTYNLSASEIYDLNGNRIHQTLNSCEFAGSDLEDKEKPKLQTFFPKDGQKNLPLDSVLKFSFSEPVFAETVEQVISLQDTAGNKIPGKVSSEYSNVLIFTPLSRLAGKTKYEIFLYGAKIKDLFGNFMPDTVIKIQFTTVNPDTFGTVTGSILSENDSLNQFTVMLSGLQMEKVEYKKILSKAEKFKFEEVLPGKYLAWSFLDKDRNEKIFFGNPNPFTPSEPFQFFADTVYVRSRWETSSVNFKF